jgi:hypothetical protein
MTEERRSVLSAVISRYVASRGWSAASEQLIVKLTQDIADVLADADFEVTRNADTIRITGHGKKSGYGTLLLVGVMLRLPFSKSRRLTAVLEAVGTNLEGYLSIDAKDTQDECKSHVYVDKNFGKVWWGNDTYGDAEIRIVIDRREIQF